MRARPDIRAADRGFSFIELLAHMAIAALLILAAVPQFQNYRGRAIDQNTMTDLRNVAAAMEAWQIDHPGKQFPHIRSHWMSEADDGTETLASLGARLSSGTEIWVDDRTAWPWPTDVTEAGQEFCIFASNPHGSRYTAWSDDGRAVAAWNSRKGGLGASCSVG